MRHVVLLRGVNVGKAKRVAMADLRRLAESLGYTRVETVLNSGNLLFDAPRARPRALEREVREALERELGVACTVIALTAPQLEEVVRDARRLDAIPWAAIETSPKHLMVHFLAVSVDTRRLDPLTARSWGDERIAVGRRVIFCWCPGGVLDGALLPAVQEALGDRHTGRGFPTVARIAAKL